MKHGSVVILMREDGAILMQHRDDKPQIAYPDYWALPGGSTEGKETPLEAAKREIFEETDYVADTAIELFTEPQVIGDRDILRHIFLMRYDGQQQINCNEGVEMRFVDPNELEHLKVFNDHIRFISRAKEMLNQGGIESRN